MVSGKFRELVKLYSTMDTEFPHLKAVTVAQWLLESNRGNSKLFLECHNAAGIKWRPEMQAFGEPTNYEAHDGLAQYVKFFSHRDFILGYWRFIDRPPYAGWRQAATGSVTAYVKFLKSRGYAEDIGYVEKVLSLLPEADELLKGVASMTWRDSDITWLERNRTEDGVTVVVAYSGSVARCIFTGDDKVAQHKFEERFGNAKTVKVAPAGKAVLPGLPDYSRGEAPAVTAGSGTAPVVSPIPPQHRWPQAPAPSDAMPKIDITEYNSPNCSERGATITGVVLHNTDGSFQSALSWLCNPAAKASAHLIIGREGQVACIVPFSNKAWHAGPANSNTIGIEIEASQGKRGLTELQEQALVSWLKWLQKKYDFKADRIISHRSVMNTNCPVWVWATDAELEAWKKRHAL